MIRHRASMISCTAALALALAPRAASADEHKLGVDPVADALFHDGKQLLKEGMIAEACQAFESSERAEHNVATLMNLADCRQRNGQLATAWTMYLQVQRESEADAMLPALARAAARRAAALAPHLSSLTVAVPAEHHLDGVAIWRDHQLVSVEAWDRAVPLDGGPHLIEVRAPGHEPWTMTIALADADDRRVVAIPPMRELPGGAPSSFDLEPPSFTDPTPAPAPALAPPRRSSTLALGIAGGGVVALAAGALIWKHAFDLQHDADAICPSAGCSDADAAHATAVHGDARGWATGGDVALVAGGAAIAGAAALWWWSERDHQRDHAVHVVPRVDQMVGLSVMGGF